MTPKSLPKRRLFTKCRLMLPPLIAPRQTLGQSHQTIALSQFDQVDQRAGIEFQ